MALSSRGSSSELRVRADPEGVDQEDETRKYRHCDGHDEAASLD